LKEADMNRPDRKELDRAEARWIEDLFTGLRPSDALALDARVTARGDSRTFVLPGVDSLFFNRAIGVAPEHVLEVTERYAFAGVDRYFVHAHEDAPATVRALERAGLRRYPRRWVKYVRDRGAVPPARTALTLRDATADDSPRVASLFAQGFDAPLTVAPLIDTMIRSERFDVLVATHHGHVVSAGALWCEGERACLAFGVTDPLFRGRGAQSALMSRRLERAFDRGCRWVATETGEALPGEPNPSGNNMLRHGFEVVGARENWALPGTTWSAEGSRAA
jgi:GNAT superfamily N-acetyltransferase